MIYGLPEKLKSLRDSKGWSQGHLGEILGLSKSAIGAYETGLSSPPLEILLQLAGLYHITVDWLLGVSYHDYIVLDSLSPENRRIVRGVAERTVELLEADKP